MSHLTRKGAGTTRHGRHPTRHHPVPRGPLFQVEHPCFGPDAVLMALIVAAFIALAWALLTLGGVQLISPNNIPGHPALLAR